jgi:hypothetical protein
MPLFLFSKAYMAEDTDIQSPESEAPTTVAPLTPTLKKKKKDKPSLSNATTKEIKRQVDECRSERADLINDWSDSVEFHRGKPFPEDSDISRIPINKDWPRVKARVSSLFGQMPEVRLLARQDTFKPALPIFAQELNDTLKRADTDEAVFQALVDNTATAGIGVVMVDYQKRTDMVDQPMIDISTLTPDVVAALMSSGKMPTAKVEVDTDAMFSVLRLSPSDLLWQTGFTGFNFDKSDWIGRTGEMGWAEGKIEFKLKAEDKEKVLSQGKEPNQTLQGNDSYQQTKGKQRVIEFDEVFYWAYRFDPKEKYFKRIRRVVFVRGLDEPVIHEDWSGQQWHEDSASYVGACRFPIRVLKINYVSDDPIPPSESAIGRPQVLELIDSRTDMHDQRKHSRPVRWVNTNKVGPETLVQLMQGTFQGFIPINGRGEDAMGELNRAQYPAENMAFDRKLDQDLDEVWQSGANQSGSFASGERSAAEAKIVQGNFDMRNGMDRAHVAKFVQGIAEVMAGLLALYGDFKFTAPPDVQRLNQGWDRKQVAGEFAYEVIPDSMVRLDAYQQIKLQMEILNMVGKSGFVNPQPIIGDILALAGKDPAKILTQPNPPVAEPLKISISSALDLHDPMMLAMLAHTKQLFSPEELEAAKKVLMKITEPPAPPQQGPALESPVGAPPNSATAPEEQNVMSKISKRSDYE